MTYLNLLALHGRKRQSIALSSSHFTLMTSHARIHVTLLSLHKRCRTGSETVLLCINSINSLTCEPSVMHRTRLTSFKTYYTALVLKVPLITVIKIITNIKHQDQSYVRSLQLRQYTWNSTTFL
jgi:hypothetical protein